MKGHEPRKERIPEFLPEPSLFPIPFLIAGARPRGYRAQVKPREPRGPHPPVAKPES